MQSIKSECSKLKCVNSEFNQPGNSLITSACSLEINLLKKASKSEMIETLSNRARS